MGKILKCVHERNATEEVLVEGSDGESPFNIFADLVNRLWKGVVLWCIKRLALFAAN